MMSLQKWPSRMVTFARYSPSSKIDGVYTMIASLLVPLDSAPPNKYTLLSFPPRIIRCVSQIVPRKISQVYQSMLRLTDVCTETVRVPALLQISRGIL